MWSLLYTCVSVSRPRRIGAAALAARRERDPCGASVLCYHMSVTLHDSSLSHKMFSVRCFCGHCEGGGAFPYEAWSSCTPALHFDVSPVMPLPHLCFRSALGGLLRPRIPRCSRGPRSRATPAPMPSASPVGASEGPGIDVLESFHACITAGTH